MIVGPESAKPLWRSPPTLIPDTIRRFVGTIPAARRSPVRPLPSRSVGGYHAHSSRTRTPRSVMPRALLAFLFVVAFVAPASAQQKGRKVAFLIGVGAFAHDLPDLNGSPQKDVTALAKEFREGGYEVVVLTD